VVLSDRADRLAALADAGTTVPAVTSTPAGWEPGVKYEPDGSRTITLPPSPALADEESWAAAIRALGADVPDGYRVRLVEAKYDPAAWHRDESYTTVEGRAHPVKTQATTRPVWRYRFVVEIAPAALDVDDLLRAIRRKRPSAIKPTPTSIATYCFAFGDTQWGKPDGDGSAGTVERFYGALDRALLRYKGLRKRGHVGPVLILVAGDCLEGTTSQGGRLVGRLDLTLTEQLRVYRRTLADAVASFADLDRTAVAVVPGNHDEVLRVGDQMASRYDDSWAIEGASQVADVVKAKGYDVGWTFPGRDGMHLTVDASGTRIGLLHGHQTKGKVQGWLAAKAMDRDAIGTADVVVSGHFHHLRLEQMGPTTHMQVGSLDGGSTWFTHRGGLNAPPAALTFMAEGGRWNGLEVV
jgi:predicted phosphodiesterase